MNSLSYPMPEITKEVIASINTDLKRRGFVMYVVRRIEPSLTKFRVCTAYVQNVEHRYSFKVECAWHPVDFAQVLALQIQDRIEDTEASEQGGGDVNPRLGLCYHYVSEFN